MVECMFWMAFFLIKSGLTMVSLFDSMKRTNALFKSTHAFPIAYFEAHLSIFETRRLNVCNEGDSALRRLQQRVTGTLQTNEF